MATRELVTMSWGFVLLRPGDAPKRVTNTRDDKLKSGFAIGQLHNFKHAGRAQRHNSRIVHEPTNDNPAHVAAWRLPV